MLSESECHTDYSNTDKLGFIFSIGVSNRKLHRLYKCVERRDGEQLCIRECIGCRDTASASASGAATVSSTASAPTVAELQLLAVYQSQLLQRLLLARLWCQR